MIKKINRFMGGTGDTFPKVGRVAGSKTEIVEIQKGERALLREILGLEEDMESDEMQAMSQNSEVWVVCQTQTRTVASAGNQGATEDSEPAVDGSGDAITDAAGNQLYVVPAYQVAVVSHVGASLQDCLANEPNLDELKAFVEGMEMRTSAKTSALATALDNQQSAIDAQRKAAADARTAANAAKREAIRARLAGNATAATNSEPVLS
jgi:hypothetical protein